MSGFDAATGLIRRRDRLVPIGQIKPTHSQAHMGHAAVDQTLESIQHGEQRDAGALA